MKWDIFGDFQTQCVCLDLAKTWTIFNPLKKSSPNTLASRKARVCPSTNFFFHHMQNICFEWTTWKWLAKPFWLLLIIYYPSLMFLEISSSFSRGFFQSCFKLFFGWLWFWCLEDNYCLYEKNDVSWPKMDQFQLKTLKLNTKNSNTLNLNTSASKTSNSNTSNSNTLN